MAAWHGSFGLGADVRAGDPPRVSWRSRRALAATNYVGEGIIDTRIVIWPGYDIEGFIPY